MKLPIPSLLQKKKSSSIHYLALLLRDEKAVAIIIEEVSGTVKVIGRHEEPLTSPLEDFEYDDLLTVLDKTISRAEETLPSSIETESTVFGVKDSWVEDKKIKKDYLSKLKRICDELSLKPIGFMVITEAISHLIQKEEGAPLSAVLADITKSNVTLSLFRAGKILESNSSPIVNSVPQTVDKLLHHFTVDVLPSRIILLNETIDENLAQEFIAHHFSKSIPFLHVPQISVLPAGFDGKAMVYGAAEQMGLSASHIFEDLVITELNTKDKKIIEEPHHSRKVQHEDEKIELNKEELSESEKESKEDAIKEDAEADEFGFVIGKDISSVKPPPYSTSMADNDNNDFSINSTESDNLKSPEFPPTKRNTLNEDINNDEKIKGGTFGAILSPISSITKLLPHNFALKVPALPHGRNAIMIPIILIALIGLTLLYVFKVKADVILTLEPKGIEKEETVTLAVGAANDFNEKVIEAKEVEVQLEGSSTITATGKKEIGEKAKGTVTLFNSSESKRTLPAGTTLTSSNNREYVTDKEVVVASASGDIFSGIKSGTAQVNVTAKQIGNEYNLPSNTKFTTTVSNTLAARNDSAFSGGSKKEVAVFSKKDADKLSTDLPESLEEKARQAIREKLGKDEEALNDFTDITLTKKNFDKDVNDEAKQVTLKATVLFTTLSYNSNDLTELAQTLLKDEFSENLSLSDKDTDILVENVNIKNDEEAEATLKIKGGLLPKINNEEIINEISGKSFSQASAYLNQLSQVKNSEIKLIPNIPLLPKYLPRVKDNISITTQTK